MSNKTQHTQGASFSENLGHVFMAYAVGIIMLFLCFWLSGFVFALVHGTIDQFSGFSVTGNSSFADTFSFLVGALIIASTTDLVCDLIPKDHMAAYAWPLMVLMLSILWGSVLSYYVVPAIVFQVVVSALAVYGNKLQREGRMVWQKA